MIILTRSRAAAAVIFSTVLFGACDDGPVEPSPPAFDLPVQVLVVSGDSLLGQINRAVGPYVVRVVDARDATLEGITIRWAVTAGGGSVSPAESVTGLTSSSQYYAATALHTLGPEDGTQTVTATAIDVPGSPQATFETRAVSGIVRVLTVSCGYYCYYDEVSFAPDRIAVPVGATVAWRWECRASWAGCPDHDVVFEDDPTEPASSPKQTEGRHLRTFDQPGSFRYRSTPYSSSFTEGMVGTVEVRAD
jgi:plastocyanin